MYCRKCYARLEPDPTQPIGHCPRCGRGFDSRYRQTYLLKPFPSGKKIAWHIITTTTICIIAAFVISLFQLAGSSGH